MKKFVRYGFVLTSLFLTQTLYAQGIGTWAEDDYLTDVSQCLTIFQEKWDYPVVSPIEPFLYETSRIWWADFSRLPKEIAGMQGLPAQTSYGIQFYPLRLTRFEDGGEVSVSHAWLETELLRLTPTEKADSLTNYDTVLHGYAILNVFTATTYDELVKAGYDYLKPRRLVIYVWVADMYDKPSYEASLMAEQKAFEAELTLASSYALSGEVDGGGAYSLFSGDPCSETNFVVRAVTKNADDSMSIVWRSETNALYTVQYTEELSTNTVWLSAIDDYPGQGCESLWTDIGDLLAKPARARPKDIEKRFYRVLQGRIQTNALPSVAVSVYSNDAANGIVTFEVTASTETNLVINRTSLYIDGVWLGDALEAPYRITVDTRRLSNGGHSVVAVAEDSAGDHEPGENTSNELLAPSKAASSALSLTTANWLSYFGVKYARFDPSQGQIQEVSGLLSNTFDWVITIKSDAGGSVVKAFTGTSASVLALWDGTDSLGATVADGFYVAEVNTVPPVVSMTIPPSMKFVKGKLGTAGIMWQGHHPGHTNSAAYTAPRRYPGGPLIQFSSNTNPPWKPIHSTYDIGKRFSELFPQFGYDVPLFKKDDEVSAADLRKASAGGSNTFNSVNIGLYVGHAAAALPQSYELAIGFPVAYIPIWNSGSQSVDWVRTTQSEFGSTNLKWMAMLVCNYFRDDPRDDVIYPAMKEHLVLPMNTSLHVLSSYKTEVTIKPTFADFWIPALTGFAGAENSTVIAAWAYARNKTQTSFLTGETDNRSRSIYWPECFGDHIYGFGSQTDPDPGNTQEVIGEFDTP